MDGRSTKAKKGMPMPHRYQPLACAGVAVLLLSGCWSPDEHEVPDTFDKAVEELAREPAISYTGSAGGSNVQIRSTSYGHATGALDAAGTRLRLLAAGGEQYVQMDIELPDMPNMPGMPELPEGETPFTDGWTTPGAGVVNPWVVTPQQLAAALETALAAPETEFYASGEVDPIGDTPVLRASTPAGDVYVTTEEPHRIARITAGEPLAPGGPPALFWEAAHPGETFPSDMPEPPAPPSLPDVPGMPDLEQPQAETSGAGDIDFEPLDPSDLQSLMEDIQGLMEELVNATDTSYQFTTIGSAAFTGCGATACTVTVTAESTYTSANLEPPEEVEAVLNVSMTGGGTSVGGCSSRGKLPVNGSGQISCTNTSPAWTSWYARAQSVQGTHVYTAQAHVSAQAMTTARVEALLEELEEWHQDAGRRTGAPSASAAPSPPRPQHEDDPQPPEIPDPNNLLPDEDTSESPEAG